MLLIKTTLISFLINVGHFYFYSNIPSKLGYLATFYIFNLFYHIVILLDHLSFSFCEAHILFCEECLLDLFFLTY